MVDENIRKTVLNDSHKNLGAKLVNFGGFQMPISYSEGIQSEYFSVRNNVGIFDVSHMGEFFITGNGAEKFLQYLTVNNVAKLNSGQAQYSAMCYPDGGIIDDLILYKKVDGYLMVVNASNIAKDFNWLNSNMMPAVTIENISNSLSLIAIQGPESRKILNKFSNIELDFPFYTFKDGEIDGKNVMISRTGYTGELGFEIYGDSDSIVHIWNVLIQSGVNPAGLASRDMLRAEMKYCLYGNEISDLTNPLEAGLGWIVDFSKDFIGKTFLNEIKKKGTNRQLVSFLMEKRGVPRKNYELFFNSKKIGEVTTGIHSPILDKGIGIAYIDQPFCINGENIFISIRGNMLPIKLIKTPFIKNTSIYN